MAWRQKLGLMEYLEFIDVNRSVDIVSFELILHLPGFYYLEKQFQWAIWIIKKKELEPIWVWNKVGRFWTTKKKPCSWKDKPFCLEISWIIRLLICKKRYSTPLSNFWQLLLSIKILLCSCLLLFSWRLQNITVHTLHRGSK